ncbi:lactonohydrolase [Metarhizium album ARSEF 1941]|uniref:Lactonohydrolase n=1 Tax=Metarhizium album (strain ARSEF 1941) TaxID=1081103 RepID=A0A0B2WMU1_METAS|nr:lactonohydrolase [Metarhizium album ARSEF 1941]KHN97386.1 lactonohydrolase [Metarhizium album ARSEF 1941]
MSLVSVSLLAAATNANYFASLAPGSNPSTPAISLRSYHPDFESVIDSEASARKVRDLSEEAFHEAGVYNPGDNSLYITSNFRRVGERIPITVVSLDSDDYPSYSTQLPGLMMANGGTTYRPPATAPAPAPRHNVTETATTTKTTTRTAVQVYCDQGDFEHYSQLVAVDPNTNESTPLLTNFLGRNFSSLNDVRQHPQTGDLWFTDADYGYFQGFRPQPSQPKQVYRFEPATGVVQVVADGFVQPNGLEFSPDLSTLYVSDTGSQQAARAPTQPSTIYAYDVVDGGRRLANRRTFAYADTGFPDGLHCDTRGNVWAACGDGVHVWNPRGVLLGKIHVGETSNNLAFVPGKVFVFSNRRLWVVEGIKAQGREVCRDFGVGCHG